MNMPHPPTQYATRGVLLAVIAAVGFSAKAIFVKLAYLSAPVDAVTLLALRMLLSVPIFIVVAAFTARSPANKPLDRHDLLLIIGLGCIGYYLSSLLDFMGLKYLSAGLERLILFLYPTFTVLLSAWLLKHPITRTHLLALVISYVGISLAFLHDLPHNPSHLWLGAGLVFASTLSYSIYLTGAGHAIARLGSLRFTALSMIVASIATLLQFSMTHPWSDLLQSKHVYLLASGMALFSTVLPVFALSAAIRLIKPGQTALIGSIGPIATIFMAWLLLDEPISAIQLTGSALVLTGVWLIGRTRRVAPAAHAPLSSSVYPKVGD